MKLIDIYKKLLYETKSKVDSVEVVEKRGRNVKIQFDIEYNNTTIVSIIHRTGDVMIDVKMGDKNAEKVIGEATFVKSPSSPTNEYFASDVELLAEYRSYGIYSTIIDFLQSHYNDVKIVPSKQQTRAGEKFWNKRLDDQ